MLRLSWNVDYFPITLTSCLHSTKVIAVIRTDFFNQTNTYVHSKQILPKIMETTDKHYICYKFHLAHLVKYYIIAL